jgi:hypothetical protein
VKILRYEDIEMWRYKDIVILGCGDMGTIIYISISLYHNISSEKVRYVYIVSSIGGKNES